MAWLEVTTVENIPLMGARKVVYKELEIAIFKTKEGELFAVHNACPHKKGKLSEGIVHDKMVTCPMHSWVIDLKSGEAQGSDCGCTKTYELKIENEMVYINL